MPAFAEHLPVQFKQAPPEPDIRFGMVEVAVGCAAQLVRDAVLMDDPGDFARMAREVCGKSRRNQQINRLSVTLGQVEEPPRGRLRQEPGFRLRAERNRDSVDLMTLAPQLVNEAMDVQFGAAFDEWHLRVGDNDAANVGVTWQTGS